MYILFRNNTIWKEKEFCRNRSGKLRCGTVLLLCMVLVICTIPARPVQGGGIKLYYYNTKKTVTYTGTRALYDYNGSSVSLGKTIGILTDNGVALGPYYEIFSRALGVSCKKDSAKNTITFRKNGNELVLTMNSTKALLNGKTVTANAAPVTVRFVDAGISRIMVPTRFVAESLGYNYRWDSDISTAIIRDTMTLSYNGKQVSYIGTTGKVNYDGTNISLGSLPSILINNTAMLRAYNVFKKAMGVSYSFNQATGKITLKKGNITLSMQENSTAAYRNGEYFDCGVAPVCITNTADGTMALMVPGRFVSEMLGYDYNWNSSTQTSEIRTTDQVGVYVAPEKPTQAPLPTYVPSVAEDQVDYSFVVDAERYLGFENRMDNAQTELVRTATGDIAILQDLTKNEAEIYNEQYVLKFDRPVGSVKSELVQGCLSVTVGDTYCFTKEYNNAVGSLVTHILQRQDSSQNGTVIELTLSDSLPYYDLTLSEDGRTLYITVFPNYLVGLETGKNQAGQYMRFKGLRAFQYTLDEENGYQAVYFHNTCNTVGNLVFPDELFENYFEHAYMVETEPNQIKLMYKTRADAKLRFEQESNALYLYFEDYKIPDSTDNSRPIAGGMFVPLPEGIDVSDLYVEDQYWNRKIVISIPGNHTGFYQANAVVNPYPVVEDIEVRSDGNITYIILTTARIQGYRLGAEGSGFALQLGNPSAIYDKIVVLDAGHGGIDPGASAGGYNEKDINFTILNLYTKEYFKNSDIKIYFTRIEDVKIDLYERADFASRVEADLFISLHMNAVSSTSVNGTSVYYSLLNTSTMRGGLNGKLMASTLTNNLSKALGTKNRGVATANFVVIRETRMPAVLIELAFITNADDRKIITTEATQRKAAKTIFDTVVGFFKDYPTGR